MFKRGHVDLIRASLTKIASGGFRGQLPMPIPHPTYQDRNHDLGGRSFYFFDFDDNVAYLSSTIVLFHKETGTELPISSAEYAQHHSQVGRSGIYRDYTLDLDDQSGSFRNFRDKDPSILELLLGRKQVFVRDLLEALGRPDLEWKGPSWSCFFHAVHNQRPLSLITARGHRPETLKKGISLMVRKGFLSAEPNYLSIFPVSHPETRRRLGDERMELSVAALKKRAIRESVVQALRTYGEEAPHRFGMSDDDPKNIQLIIEEMGQLKQEFPHLSFFVIDSCQGELRKWEIYPDHLGKDERFDLRQLKLF